MVGSNAPWLEDWRLNGARVLPACLALASRLLRACFALALLACSMARFGAASPGDRQCLRGAHSAARLLGLRVWRLGPAVFRSATAACLVPASLAVYLVARSRAISLCDRCCLMPACLACVLGGWVLRRFARRPLVPAWCSLGLLAGTEAGSGAVQSGGQLKACLL